MLLLTSILCPTSMTTSLPVRLLEAKSFSEFRNFRFGIQKLPIGRRRQVLENQAINLFEELPCLAIPKQAVDYYAPMKDYAEQQGTPLSENDLWIASTAMVLDAILVTADSDFQRIAEFGLKLEDWTN